MRVLLFDIDGTLLREGLAPKLAFSRALRETYDTTGPVSSFKFAGMTDPECVVEIMRLAGLPDSLIHERRDDCLRRYVEHLRVEMGRQEGAKLLPGVRELLESLSARADVLVGLLTGNVSGGARLKLGRFRLERYFRFGAFGDDHADRAELARIALEKASSLLGRPVGGADSTVVGDTPRDVRCARAVGARAVAVATGQVSWEELQASEPDALLESFASQPTALKALLP